MTSAVPRPVRNVALALVAAMLLALAAPSSPARAHAGCVPSAAPTGVIHAVMNVVNVFSAVLNTQQEATCESKFADVEPVMDRDYTVAETSTPRGNASANGNAPKSFAPCIDGMAVGTFPCDGVDMLGHVTMEELGSVFVNDMWGWTDPETREEYALVGGSEGMFVVNVSDPKRPEVMGLMPTHSTEGGDFWRDIKVYEDHAFVVSENSGHGVQVFDLTRLRDWSGERETWTPDARYDGVGSVHNIAINEDTGFAYAVGSSASQTRDDIECGSGLHMIDISEPTSPTYAGCFQDHGYVHDTHCVTYDGLDAEHRGSEICFNSTPSGPESVSIVDVTDKANPVALAEEEYDAGAYSHQGWLSPGQDTFFHGDEIDEASGQVASTTTRVWDLTDLDAPVLAETFANDTTSIDHNMYTEGRYMYQSNYTTGLRVMDIRDAATEGLEEVGFFDVYPDNDNASFEGGTWSNYPYFADKDLVAVSSIDRGLFLLRPRVGTGGR